jgi:hypothetical protein
MNTTREAASKFNPMIGCNVADTCSLVAFVLDVLGNINYSEAGTGLDIGLALVTQTAAKALRFEAGEDD